MYIIIIKVNDGDHDYDYYDDDYYYTITYTEKLLKWTTCNNRDKTTDVSKASMNLGVRRKLFRHWDKHIHSTLQKPGQVCPFEYGEHSTCLPHLKHMRKDLEDVQSQVTMMAAKIKDDQLRLIYFCKQRTHR